jgi:hypothetical protein
MRLKSVCFTIAMAGLVILPGLYRRGLASFQSADTADVKDQARVIQPRGDGDEIIKVVPHLVLKKGTTYVFSVSVTPSLKTMILISRRPTSSNITSWERVGRSHDWPDEKKFELNSADAGEKLEVLITAWGDPTEWTKGSSVPTPLPLMQPQTDKGTSLPHTFEFELNKRTVRVTVSRK